MNLVPQRQSLLSQTTSILRQALKGGEWGKYMPGERKLCGQMQVGRDTLRLAIQQMEREGLLAVGEPGKRRRILVADTRGSKPDKGARNGQVFYLSPYPLKGFSAIGLLEIDVLRESLGNAGLRLEVISSAAFSLKRPGKTLNNLVAENSAAAWILHQSTAAMQRWFSRKAIPCLLHGHPQEGVNLPSIDIDYSAVTRHCGGYLIGLGHRKVAMLRPAESLRGLKMAESGLFAAFASHRAPPLPPPVIAQEGPDKSSLISKLSELMGDAKTRPTALVATRSRQIPTVISWLAQHGLSVPRDLSLVALDYSPNLDYLVPEIASYQIDPVQVAKTLHRKVIDVAGGAGAAARSPQPIVPEFIPGGSVARLNKS